MILNYVGEKEPTKKPRLTETSGSIPEMNLSCSDFAVISKFNTFVDKSLIIEVIIRKKEFCLVTAPRRFGKTSILSLIKCFFTLEEKEGVPVSKSFVDDDKGPIIDTPNYKLFADRPLAIAERKSIMTEHFGKYPVIFIDFQSGRIGSMSDVENEVGIIISRVFCCHKYLMKSSQLDDEERESFRKFCKYDENKKFVQENIGRSLRDLSCYLKKHFNRKCVVLIDEYDHICSKSMLNLSESDTIVAVIEFFISILGFLLKSNDVNVEFAFLTGISFICTAGMSSIVTVFPHKFLQNEEYVQFYGLTEEEFISLLKPYVSEIVLNEAKVYYNGYEYCGKKMYSLWSALNFLKTNSKQVANYWVTSGMFFGLKGALKNSSVKFKVQHLLQGNTLKINSISKLYPEDVVTLRKNFTNPNLNIIDVDPLFNFYLEQGYLTTTSAILRNSLNVKIPNPEIKAEFLRLTKEYYTTAWGMDFKLVNNCAFYMNNIFDDPKTFVEKFCDELKNICKKLTLNDGHPLNEAALHHIVYCIIVQSRYRCLTEINCVNRKRLDLCSIFEEYGIVIELKVNGSSSNAVKQIVDNEYHSIFENAKYVSIKIVNYVLLGINITKRDDDIEVDFSYLVNNDDVKKIIES